MATERLTDEEVRRQQNDLEMMQRPHMWPWGDRLPMKRRVSYLDKHGEKWWTISHLGLLLAEQEPRLWQVNEATGFVGADRDLPELKGEIKNPKTPHVLTYESFEAIVDDGWVVD